MAFAELRIFSESLGMQTTVNVVIPQKSVNGEIGTNQGSSANNLKCLYLLHGLSDDCSIWMRRTSVERYAQDYGICVIMPEAARSFYTDMKYGMKYYTYISQELPRIISNMFNVSGKREDNYIAGLSMGGYGALKIALKNGGSFCAAAGLSSVADLENQTCFDNELASIFGENTPVPDSDSLFKLAEKHAKDADKPRLFMGIGTEDWLYEGNVRLKEHLEGLGYDLTYRESAGVHCWEFWDEYIQYALKWMFPEK